MTFTIDDPRLVGDGDAPTGNLALRNLPLAIRVTLGALGLGPAAIHFGMIPSHAAESTAQAIGFAVAAWLGALLAIAALVRPSRGLLAATAGLNAAMIAIWARSRTAGLPVGAHSGHAEAVTGVDLLATGMEAAALLLCLALLLRPGIGRRLGVAGMAVGGAIAGFAMLATSVALASPSARDHAANAHGDEAAGHSHSDPAGVHEGLLATNAQSAAEPATADAAGGAVHSHGDEPAAGASGATAAGGSAAVGAIAGAGISDPMPGAAATTDHHGTTHGMPSAVALSDRCDLAFNPVSFWDETRVVHEGAASSAAIVGTATLDSLIADTTKPGGELKDATVVANLARASDADYDAWLNWLPSYVGASHSAAAAGGAPDDNAGHGGHLGPQAWTPMTNQAECDQLASELERARTVALKYPHPGDAEAAGWRRVTGYVPGIAAHYMNFGYLDGTFNVDEPEMLLYDGEGPDASMVGLSYYVFHDSDYEPTQGFTGPNDHFHRHIGLCTNGTSVVGDSSLTEEECTARGGQKRTNTGGWMNHVWIVPGCESPWGMFSGASPLLDRQLNDNSGTDGGACGGSAVRQRFDLTAGTVDSVEALLEPAEA